ncbi:hypothetical protein BSP109_02016 [Brevibacterium sp. Mu109]|uniref:hypothetical protein n=1 Tax=Brevibacterium sp. Mu109 TaxID=1255669 RepID=UPI000C5A7499|nr:hypothetical protein [Brevibacterium sp. Mu109]SMX85155.1 hypothetical protein BSP109_02016 [Brevibacterium sp. Mu109]
MKIRSLAIATVAVSVSALTLSACGGTTEWNGQFTVANGDSSFYVGNLHRADNVTVECSEKGGTISATITASDDGSVFTTTQPDDGSGPAGGTLKMGDGEEFTWEVSDSGNAEHPFENDEQTGSPVTWTDTGVVEFGSGLRQATTKSDEGEVRVQIPGQVDCASGSEG